MAPGTRSKFDAPMFKPEVVCKQIYCIEENTCDIAGTFRCPPPSLGAPIAIWRPGNCAPLAPLSLRPCIYAYHSFLEAPLDLETLGLSLYSL